ncbi:MAG: hypothetical protein HY583_00760 [Candidatus Omnitrophica bacterium]|nr:hypothetical protein [Candidatus Omnitrophota bacterium]
MEKILLKWDTSIAIMIEAQNRGHQIFYIEPDDIFLRNNRVWGNIREVNASRAFGFRTLGRKLVNLNRLDTIFNRKDPPFNLSYLYLTQMLELLEPDVFVINSPAGVRKANEKLYILEFPNWIPPTMITNNPVEIERFRKKLKCDVVIKRLDQKGGKGIRLVAWKRKRSFPLYGGRLGWGLSPHLSPPPQGGRKVLPYWVMVQKYLHQNTKHGDKRILVLNGEIIGQFARIPKPGEFRSNLSLGGKHVRTTLTKRDLQLVKYLKPKLIRDGLYFVGLDVIDGKLIEINVTSPAGITEINELEGTHPEVQVVNFLEAKAASH